MEILNLCDITKTYGQNRAQVKAVNHLNLTIEKGSFTSIIGRSGSGKSTLLKICAGLLQPESGSVILDGEDLTKMKEKDRCTARRKKIGFIFQSFDLIPEFTVLENICLPAYLDHQDPDTDYIDKILKDMEMEDKRYRFPDELSGGEQQRVAIARALSLKPALLLADEPTGNLDVRTGETIIDLLDFCNFRYHQTVLMVTHNLELIHNTHKIVRMQDGKIVDELEKELVDEC